MKKLDEYGASLVADEKDGALLRADRLALSSYDTVREHALALSRAGKKDEGRELMLASQASIVKLADALKEHAQYNVEIGAANSVDANRTRARALWISVAVGLLCLAALIAQGIKTTRWLLTTLGGEPSDVAGIAREIADGNLSNQINLHAGDTASLLATVANMQSNLKADIDKERAAAAENDGMVAALDKAMAQIEFELDGTITTANNNFLSVMGYSLEEIRGRNHSMFIPAAEAATPAYKQFWEKLRSVSTMRINTAGSTRPDARFGCRQATARSWMSQASRSRWSNSPSTSPTRSARLKKYAPWRSRPRAVT